MNSTPEKEDKKFSKSIVRFIILSNVTFTIIVLYIFYTTGSEPIALIGAWFAFTTGELFLLAGIRKKEISIQPEMMGTNCEDGDR